MLTWQCMSALCSLESILQYSVGVFSSGDGCYRVHMVVSIAVNC